MLYHRNLGWIDKTFCRFTNSNATAFCTNLDYKPRIRKTTGRTWVPGTRFKRNIILFFVLFLALGSFLCLLGVPGRGRHPESSRAVSKEIGDEGPGGKMTGLSPGGLLDKESLPGRVQGVPEINPADEGIKGEMKGGAADQDVPGMQRKVKVIGNRDSRRYHLPGMKYYDSVLAYHRMEFISEEEAVQAGYHKATE